MFEAGFMPGKHIKDMRSMSFSGLKKVFLAVCYFIAIWYRVEERNLHFSIVVAHASLAGAFGGAIAYGVGKIDRAKGLDGLRGLFVIEGTISAACAILVVCFLPDWPSPRQTRFHTEEEKKFAVERVAVQRGGYTRDHVPRREILEKCFSPRVLAHYLMFTLENTCAGSLTFYTPTIVTGLGYKSLQAQLMTIPPCRGIRPISYCLL